ncbi:WD repeat-containing protein 70-like [Patiria miniata]|uniref:WD repeat-containing protein 70 n=1 Tax=Patiria miniata TaxID=46514 RepID=A0A913Z9Z6_PATMI|nr:WD repeat-containing protein 70-like [Patiria miniata]
MADSDDDLEEMRRLRNLARGQSSTTAMRRDQGDDSEESFAKQEDDNMASVMGFSGFGKKARTFDVSAMFEQTRRTAQQLTVKKPDDSPMSVKHTGKRAERANSAESSNSDDSEDTSDSDTEMIGPPMPPGFQAPSAAETSTSKKKQASLDDDDDDDDDEDDEEEDDDDNLVNRIPASHEIVLNHGAKTVSAISLDPSGSRLVTGGFDYEMKMWDFAAMDSSLHSFRSLQPCSSHQIKTLQYSITGDCILVAAAKAQAKVIDRDGFEVMECAKGDQYIVDMAKTKGHVASLNGACWNPKVKEEFITCSDDGTVRIWDFNQPKRQKEVIKFRSVGGRKTVPTCCTFSRDAKLIAAPCQDGSLQLWDVKKPFIRPTYHQKTAHAVGSDSTCIAFSYDNSVFATRGGDDTMKLWDLRNFKRPINVTTGLTNYFPVTDCVFSPDDKMLVTCTSVKKGQGEGKLIFLDRETFDTVTEIPCGDVGVARCLWHPKLNQIIVGCSNGDAKIFYDPNKSHRGAKLCVVKKKRKVKELDIVRNESIITPHMLRMYRKDQPKLLMSYKQSQKDRQDPVKSHRPDLPLKSGRGGRVGSGGASLSSYVAKVIAVNKKDDSNPREAILRHAKEASDNPFWISPAYSETQPKAIFQEESDEEVEDNTDVPHWAKKQKLDTDKDS